MNEIRYVAPEEDEKIVMNRRFFDDGTTKEEGGIEGWNWGCWLDEQPNCLPEVIIFGDATQNAPEVAQSVIDFFDIVTIDGNNRNEIKEYVNSNLDVLFNYLSSDILGGLQNDLYYFSDRGDNVDENKKRYLLVKYVEDERIAYVIPFINEPDENVTFREYFDNGEYPGIEGCDLGCQISDRSNCTQEIVITSDDGINGLNTMTELFDVVITNEAIQISDYFIKNKDVVQTIVPLNIIDEVITFECDVYARGDDFNDGRYLVFKRGEDVVYVLPFVLNLEF